MRRYIPIPLIFVPLIAVGIEIKFAMAWAWFLFRERQRAVRSKRIAEFLAAAKLHPLRLKRLN